VQQAWFNLSRRYGKVENRAILFTAIRNQFYDNCRRAKIVQFEAIENTQEAESRVNEERVSTARGDLGVLLAHLSEREREVLYLNCVEGYTASEISEQIGSPRGTILSLLSRAKQKLHKIASGENIWEGATAT
jgi:RNA polymerase sigma-70 factor (ECF subfamily)